VALAAASAASAVFIAQASAQNNPSNEVVISTAGSTALKNWFVAKTTTFTDVQPGTTITIGGTTYPPSSDGGASYWNTGSSYQLAPKTGVSKSGTSTDASPAIQFVYHESGSVEGILELANDQLYTNSDYAPSTGIASTSIPYVTANIDRNPEGGNAVWLNYNQLGNSGTTPGATFNATSGASVSGTPLSLGNFYAPGVGQATTPGATTIWVPGSSSNPTPDFNQTGANVNGGQNAVQVALSDALPQQVFKNDYGNQTNAYTPVGGTATMQVGASNSSFNSNPLDLGYGSGNSSLVVGSLGTPGFRATYQSPSSLIPSPTAQNPRAPQGTDFGTGPWSSGSVALGGIGNLNSQLTAVTATAFVANPGTGLSQLDRTDADWLEMTSRLANGASFNMTTRDVNSGTRDVSSLDTGVDPTWSTGVNDDGNGNLPNAANTALFDQASIGPAMRFSNKTAGGAELRPTVQDNRMSVGTLSINDAGSHDTQGIANPVRVLAYSDSTDGSSPYVSPDYATISNGTYVIYQNEQVVTLKNMSSAAAYNDSYVYTAANGAQLINGTVQGDDSSGDVVTLLNQTANSVSTALSSTSPADSADGLLQQGYLVPQLMAVEKNLNGQGLINGTAGQIDTGHIQSQTNPNYNGTLFGDYADSSYTSALPDLTTQEPTTGNGSTYGGGEGQYAATNHLYNSTGGAATAITTNNYIFGNFNQNGDRDFNAVKSALNADEALIQADRAVSASYPGSEFTSEGDNNESWNGTLVAGGTNGISNNTTVDYTDALGVMHTNLTKGDLIVMGDYNGDGHFDGSDLRSMAMGVALSDNTSTDRLSTDTVENGVLDKNAAMNYLNSALNNTGAVASDLYIRQTAAAVLETATPSTPIPAGATAVTNRVSGTAENDPVSGNALFTYDPNGVNAFNTADVNDDGTIDFNDAVLVDQETAAEGGAGANYQNIDDQTSATMQAPVTGNIVPLNLVAVEQIDGESHVTQADVNVIDSQFVGSGTTNWYGFNLQKTGASTIAWERTGGQVNVYAGASFEISAGTVQIGSPSVSGTIDPFSGTGPTAGNHVAVTLDHGGKLVLASDPVTYTVAGLSIDTSSNSVMDLGDNTMIVNYGASDPLATIQGYIKVGFNGGSWNGPGVLSSVVAAANAVPNGPTYGIGFADGNDQINGHSIVAGLSSGQIELKYTLLGDANLDGTVNGSDFSILAANFGLGYTNWDQGNFLFTPTINGADFAALAHNFGLGASYPGGGGGGPDVTPAEITALDAFAAANGLAAPNFANVPEPATASLAILAGAGLLARRRRR
jgi:hypothetical protein